MIFLGELDGSSGIKNIFTDRLNLGGLQVDKISPKITAESTKEYIATNQVNQSLIRCFLSENLGRGISTIFRLSVWMYIISSCWIL